MKKLPAIVLLFSYFLFSSVLHSQSIFDKVKQKVKDKTNQRVDEKTDKAVDKSLDNAENATKSTTSTSTSANTASAGTKNDNTADKSKPADFIAYGKYDFVPGDKVIFEDHVTGETLGEFPSKWNLRKGKIEVAAVNGEQVIAFLEGNYAAIAPLMKATGDYLPDVFSVEFDQYVKSGGYTTMEVNFHDQDAPGYVFDDGDVLKDWISTGSSGQVLQASGDIPAEAGGEAYFNKWHHIALSYNMGHIKIYTDQYRLCNLPNVNGKTNPQNILLGCIGAEDGTVYIKNVRIAAGGGDLYKRVTTDGKIVTHGILFDVNKSVIRPESMGTLNEIVKLMNDNPDLKFEVGGHTDTDGSADANIKLSQDRADAVKNQLIKMGINGNRLKSKGYGQGKPIDTNGTPEGKANNRRWNSPGSLPEVY